jgi:hypothetical protein
MAATTTTIQRMTTKKTFPTDKISVRPILSHFSFSRLDFFPRFDIFYLGPTKTYCFSFGDSLGINGECES